MKIYTIALLVLLPLTAYSMIKPQAGMGKRAKTFLKQVQIEKGGVLVLEQYLKKSESYNGDDPYTVEFLCEKNKIGKTQCSINKYHVFHKHLMK